MVVDPICDTYWTVPLDCVGSFGPSRQVYIPPRIVGGAEAMTRSCSDDERIAMNRVWAISAAVSGAATGLAVGLPSAPAGATGYTVTSTNMCGGAGTFQQALQDANANPGPDTITFTPGLVVDAWTCNSLPAPIYVYPLSVTDTVTIIGSGATIAGGQIFVNSAGRVNDPNSCPSRTAGTLAASISVGFLEVGTFDVDNSAIALTVSGLNFSGLPSLFLVEKNASLSLSNSTADKTMSFNNDCTRPPIQSTEGNVTLSGVVFHDSSTPALHVDDPNSDSAVVVGLGSGALAMDHVTMDYNFSGRAVIWGGATAKIANSQFYESGGLWLNGANSEIINSVWRTDRQKATDRIISTTGTARIDASTFYWSQPECGGCASPSLGFATAGSGQFDFHSTAIGAGADYPGAAPLLWGNTSTGFTSDALTWVQPTGTQDASAIGLILPNALTDAPGLNPSFVASLTNGDIADVTPLNGTIATPGVLVDAVANATCTTPNDANKLIDPIDSTCITTDVFGKPRWDAGNNRRDIGGVQTAQSPHLAVSSVTADIGLSWNRPPDPGSGAIIGYRVTYVPVAGGTPSTVDVSGADSTTTAVTGLTLGTPYRFTVVPLNGVGPGTPSNEVQATPIGPVAAPTVTATGGDGSVQVFWPEPSLGGHSGPPSYYVTFRPTGTTTWFAGPGPLAGRTTTIPGLVNGTTYDIGVVATSTDGTPGALATSSATPSGSPAAPTETATPGGAGTGQIILTWTPPADGGAPITGYLVQCRVAGSSTWTAETAVGLTTSLTVTGLQPSTAYECQVAAVNANGTGPWSASASATSPGSTPTTTSTTTTTPTTTTVASSSGGEQLASTGSDLAFLLTIGLSLVAVGIALITSRRRRRCQA